MSAIPTRVQSVGTASAERVTAFLRAVYGWMFVGLAITTGRDRRR